MLKARYTGRASSLSICRPNIARPSTANLKRFFETTRVQPQEPLAIPSPRPEDEIASTRPEPVMSEAEMSALPPLPPPFSSRFQSILSLKLKLLSAPQTPTNREHKLKVLTEILDVFGELVQNRLLNNVVRSELFAALCANILRPVPKFDGITVVDETVKLEADSKSCILQSCYILLLRLQTFNPRLPCFSQKFALDLIEVSGIRESKERESLLRFLEVYVTKHIRSSDGLLVGMCKYLERFISESNQSPFRVAVILRLILIIMKNRSLKLVHRKVFLNYILPLFKSPYFNIFQTLLVEICNVVSEEDRYLSATIVRSCCKWWPRTCASKQAVFMALMTVHSSKMPSREFTALLPKIFEANADCIKSTCPTVTNSSLLIWVSLPLEAAIKANASKIYPIVIPALLAAPKYQWNEEQRETVASIAKVMSGHNPELYKQLALGRYESGQSEQKRIKWKEILEMAEIDNQLEALRKGKEIEELFPWSKPPQADFKETMPSIRARAMSLNSRTCPVLI